MKKKTVANTYWKHVVDEMIKDERSIVNTKFMSIKLDETYKCSDERLGMYVVEYYYPLHLVSLGVDMGKAEMKLQSEKGHTPLAGDSGRLCDGCNVLENWEHRCHGNDCECGNPICMKLQGRITHEELMETVNKELNGPKP